MVGDFGLGDSVVMQFMDGGNLNRGHHLFTDIFYSSRDLFNSLTEKNTGACGTVKVIRKPMPES